MSGARRHAVSVGLAIVGGGPEIVPFFEEALAHTVFVIRAHVEHCHAGECSTVVAGIRDPSAELVVLVVDDDGRWLDCATHLAGQADVRTVLVGSIGHAHFLAAVRSGIVGFAVGDVVGELPRVFDVVRRGEMAIPRILSRVLVDWVRRHPVAHHFLAVDGRVVDFSEREWEVVALLGDRASTRSIADRLYISQVTVRTHVSVIVHKLGVADRAAAAELIQRHR